VEEFIKKGLSGQGRQLKALRQYSCQAATLNNIPSAMAEKKKGEHSDKPCSYRIIFQLEKCTYIKTNIVLQYCC